MPGEYRGRIRIRCLASVCIYDALRKDVLPGCVSCEKALPEIMDLDDRELSRIPQRPTEPSAEKPAATGTGEPETKKAKHTRKRDN